MSDGFVVLMGVVTVFVGLIALIVLCSLMGAICKRLIPAEKKPDESIARIGGEPSEANREELIAAITCVLAEEMGTDVSALRVLSFKRV